METYDFVVIGGGPAGCVVTSRLTEDKNVSVALIEAGPDKRGYMAEHLMVGTLAWGTKAGPMNYGFETVPQEHLNGRKDYHALGRGLGGGTAINTAMYMRGNKLDYDEWAAMGNEGWSYKDVLPYFKKSENNQTHKNKYHGTDGPLWVEELRTDNPYHGIVHQACEQAGLKHNPDFAGDDTEGYGSVQVFMKNGKRNHAGQSFIYPHLGVRKNLTLQCDTECTRIIFEGKRAVGIEVVNNGEKRIIRARREVLIAGGGVLSPKILQLSGVGDPNDIVPHGIAMVHELKGVGKNLSDHIDVVLGYEIPNDPNLLGISPVGAWSLIKSIFKWRKEKRGMLATNFAELSGFMRLTPQSPKPEIQYEFVIALAMDHGRKVMVEHGMSCHVLLLHPKSRGTVKIASADYKDFPLVDFEYFKEPGDIETMLEGVKRTAAIFETPAFKSRIKRDLVTAHCKTDADWIEFLRNGGGTNYHPVGSCQMGTGELAVVDSRLKVYGLEGLRVIDCSIMPSITGGNTTAPTIMIAEKAADMIKADWQPLTETDPAKNRV